MFLNIDFCFSLTSLVFWIMPFLFKLFSNIIYSFIFWLRPALLKKSVEVVLQPFK